MNVLGICGSPHRQGNTAHALRHALQVIEGEEIDTSYLSLADYQIAPCRGCFTCRRGTCVQEDDMAIVVEAIDRCDGLILASPVYMGLITGQMNLSQIERQTGVAAQKIIQKLGLPETVSLNESLGRLRRRYGFSITEVRDIVTYLMKKR